MEHLGFKTSERDHLSQVEQTHHQVTHYLQSYSVFNGILIFNVGLVGMLVVIFLMIISPVSLSLTYSCDGHHLYTANSEGTVMAWCRRDQQRMKLPMFYSFLSSYAAG